MKKLCIALILFCSINAFSQTESTFSYTEFHEPKLNLGYLILGNFDATYELLLSQESGVGVNLMIPFDDYIDWNINYNLTGYYRFYFGENYADGFFGEVFTNLNNVDDRIEVEGGRTGKKITDLALGLSGGYKVVSNGGVVLEVFLGGGRNLFSEYNSRNRNFDFILRAGLNVGYRF